MLRKAVVFGLAMASLSGTLASAQSYEDIYNLKMLQQQRRALEPGGGFPEDRQESRFCQEPSFQGSNSVTLKTRRMLGCKDQQYLPNPRQTSQESRPLRTGPGYGPVAPSWPSGPGYGPCTGPRC
jgi:hypothetical protein